MGVARVSAGGIGGRPSVGKPPLAPPFATGLAFGEAGIDRPSRGGPLWPPGRPPGMGGRRRGTGADMLACECGDGPVCEGSI